MKLLVIGPDIRDLRRVKNFTGVQAYYLARELRKRGVQMVFINGKHADPLKQFEALALTDCDHALALGLRWFTHQPEGCAGILKTKVKGAVTQLHDGLVHSYLAPFMTDVDCTFTFRDDSKRTRDWVRFAHRYHFIGWAADPDLLYPEQRSDELRILIDHPYYKGGTPDISNAVAEDVALFARAGYWRDAGYNNLRIRRLVNGGAEDVNLNDGAIRPFDRRHIPFPDIAEEYRKTHVYIVTHKESVGLTCLEVAYCGGLVVTAKGLIYEDRLETMRHVVYENARIPWARSLSEINILASAEMARKQSWDDVADRMLKWFEAWK